MTPKLLTAMLFAGALVACSPSPQKSPDVTAGLRQSFDQAGFKDVSVSQDRDKGVVTLSGHVATDADKAQAESLAKAAAAGEVVANEIAVLPPGNEGDAKKIDSAMDDGIESNVKALLIQRQWKDAVSYAVKNGVVTLTGDVTSQNIRGDVAKAVATVPNVTQVVNELQVKAQKATSAGGGSV